MFTILLLPRRMTLRNILLPLLLFQAFVLIWLLAPLVAHAQGMPPIGGGPIGVPVVADPTGLITALVGYAAILFPGLAHYLPTVLLIGSMIGGLCLFITAAVPPPTTTSPHWWVLTYKAINFLAINFGHARNATVAGMQPDVRDASIKAAKLTQAAPDLAELAPPTIIVKPVITPGGTA